MLSKVKSKFKVCMLAYTFYESDGRVMMYSEALSKKGAKVDVFALSRNGQPFYEKINGVHVYRIQERKVNEKGLAAYISRILKFFILSAFYCTKMHIKAPYRFFHIHSVPDFEVFATLIPKLLGAKVILDIHDLVPEFYIGKFNKTKNAVLYKLLLFIEKLSIFYADHVIIANELWRETIRGRSLPKNTTKLTTVLNYPDLNIFSFRKVKRDDNKFKIIYPGSLNWHQGIDIAINAINLLKDKIPTAELHVYGEGSEKNRLFEQIKLCGLKDRVFLHDKVPTNKIPDLIAESDVGIVPKRADSFGNEAFSTKILEFMAMGLPVIVSNTKIDLYYFNPTLVQFFNSGDEKDLAQKILKFYSSQQLRKRLVKNGLSYIKKNNWNVKNKQYFHVIESLFDLN